MKKNKVNSPSTFRKRAEEMVRHQSIDVSALSLTEIQQMIHELQVRQIELKLQNEELRQTQQISDSQASDTDLTKPIHIKLAIEELSRVILSNISDAVFITDDQGVFTFICPNVSVIFGHTFAEVQTMGNISNLLGDDIFAPEMLETSGELANIDREIVDKAGQIHSLLVTVKQVSIKDGTRLYTCRDITERKQTEVEFKRVFNLSPDLVGIGSLDGYFTRVNSSFKQMLGYENEEFLAKPFIDFVHVEDAEITLATLNEVLKGKRNLLIQNRYRCKDGSYKWIEWHSIGLVEEGIFYMTGRDITERRQREKEYVQQERLAAVGQLAAGIAHDFNNVLTGIILQSELLQISPNVSEKNLEGLELIIQQGMHAAKLIQQILDFSRHSIRDPRPLDLKMLLNNVLGFLKRTIPEHIQIQFSFALGDYMVNADPTQLQQLITNLIVNAQAALPQGGTLHLSLSHLTLRADEMPPAPNMEPGMWVNLAITDTGIGIAPDVLPHIFEPFFTTKEPDQGTGLGLAQVYGIVKQHEGYITVNSQLNKGTTFTTYLPMLLETVGQAIESPTTLPKGQGETILLVEDNQIVMETIQNTLKSLNYQVLTAKNGVEALTVYHAQPNKISLILTDVVMPKMDGLELTRILHQQFPQPKVLLMSGFPLGLEVKQLSVNWLSKPLERYTLARVLQEMLWS